MNRLVIIGNGFDLAHGLPTRYKDFIDDYWKDVIKHLRINQEHNDSLITIDIKSSIRNLQVKQQFDQEVNDYKSLIQVFNSNLKFNNTFFNKICDINLENWVDVENEYYRELKKIVRYVAKPPHYVREEDYPSERKKQVKKLNKEFNDVKDLLEMYLNEKVVAKYNFSKTNSEFHDIFYPDILDDLKIDEWKKDFSKADNKYIDELIKEDNHKKVKLRFLNFNYTPTLSIYYNMYKSLYNDSVYFIHGELKNANNKINFGFGDEMDEDYKMIENINDNEYLKNFKSFQYLQNDTYKKLLDFIEDEKFEVYIMGSSCGLSDRTLLNTIFEHDNCRLIKVFYYQWKDDETEETKDNFTELTQNISRHFNDKKLMRSKIVHKKPEHVMPKIQLTKKV